MVVWLNHTLLERQTDSLWLDTNVIPLCFILEFFKLFLDISKILFNCQHVCQEHFILPIDFKLAQTIVKVLAARRCRAESANRPWWWAIISFSLQSLDCLIVDTAFRKVEQGFLSWWGLALFNQLIAVVHRHLGHATLWLDHWGLFSIHNLLNYFMAIWAHRRG